MRQVARAQAQIKSLSAEAVSNAEVVLEKAASRRAHEITMLVHNTARSLEAHNTRIAAAAKQAKTTKHKAVVTAKKLAEQLEEERNLESEIKVERRKQRKMVPSVVKN